MKDRIVESWQRSWRPFLAWMGLLLAIHQLLRLLFWWANRGWFPKKDAPSVWEIWSWGLQLDLSAQAWWNAPVFISYFISLWLWGKSLRPVRALAIFLNSVALALGVADIGYFPFSRHRANIDLWYVTPDSLPGFQLPALRYVYLAMVWLFFVALLWWTSRKILTFSTRVRPLNAMTAFSQVAVLAGCLLLARGWQARPLVPSSPLLSLDSRWLPVAQNSAGSFLYSLKNRPEQLPRKAYYSSDTLWQKVPTSQRCCSSGPWLGDSNRKRNVVLFILESFSKFYLNEGPRRARTPFLDSILSQSLRFENAYANGFSSNQGIVAILGGLPAFLDEPFYYSAFANTPLRSIGNILLEKGYRTHFFMGTPSDHFGFEKFGRMAGLRFFHGKDAFADPSQDDGNWGIYDGPFLTFSASALCREPGPYFAVVYNLSSHPPFALPKDFVKYAGAEPPAQRAISYVDESLRKFFEKLKTSAGFSNTLFVFCADHYLYPDDGSATNPVVASQIPFFIFDPERPQGVSLDPVVSQVDLTPILLHLLGLQTRYDGFGRDALDSSLRPGPAVNRYGSTYQMIDSDYAMGYDAPLEKPVFIYRILPDSVQSLNPSDPFPVAARKAAMEGQIQALLQAYGQVLRRRSFQHP